jgi:glycosyltransferase involved in cell wall biosynthesis
MSREGDTSLADLVPVHVVAVGSHSISAPSFRIRALLPRTRLAKAQVFLSPLTLLTEREDAALHRTSLPAKFALLRAARKRLHAEIDSLPPSVSVTLIQRQADIFPTKAIEKHAIGDRPLVYDIDDAIWFDARHANGSIFAFLKGSQRKTRWLTQRAEHVIAGNDILAEHLAPHAKHIAVIPSAVDTTNSPVRAHVDNEDLTVGWIGSRTTAPYVSRVREALTQLAKELRPRQVRLLMVGGDVKPPSGVEYESTPWSVENERKALTRMDVGIMPQPDTPWTRGKCAYKAIQYMAAGIPVIADDVGVATAVVADSGIIIQREHEWLEALFALAGDSRLRSELGSRGRTRARQAYSVEGWAPVLADVLRRARQ